MKNRFFKPPFVPLRHGLLPQDFSKAKVTPQTKQGMVTTMKTGLPYVAAADAEILILGSLPGDASINAQQYYAHPRNHFWGVLSALLGVEFNNDYTKRLEVLKQNKIALWDVLQSAQREGSLDSKIKNHAVNDLHGFLKTHKNVKLIVLNGKKAEECFLKSFADIKIPHATMRSTSPVASQSCNTLEEKIANWRAGWGT